MPQRNDIMKRLLPCILVFFLKQDYSEVFEAGLIFCSPNLYNYVLDIISLTIEQLTNILDLLSMQITKYFLPNKEDIGEPFWTIMELNEVGEINGNYYSMQPNEQGHQNGIALFFSKIDAEIHLSKMPDRKKWAVRGLRQYNLKAILEFSKKIHDYTFYIVRSIVTIQDSNYMVQKLNDKKLQKEYLHIK